MSDASEGNAVVQPKSEDIHPENNHAEAMLSELLSQRCSETPFPNDDRKMKPDLQVFGGFQAYANINPFDTKLFQSYASVNSLTINSNIEGHVHSVSATTPSPKSPNPFSNPSPAQNPFMTFVDSKTNLWSTVAGAAAAGSSAAPTQPAHHFPTSATPLFKRSVETFTNADSDQRDLKRSKSDGSEFAKNDNSQEEDGNAAVENGLLDPEDDITTGVYGKIYHLPENIPIVTGEEGEQCVLQMRVKLYRLQIRPPTDDDKINNSEKNELGGGPNIADRERAASAHATSQADWVEVGVGPVKVLLSTRSKISQSGSSNSLEPNVTETEKEFVAPDTVAVITKNEDTTTNRGHDGHTGQIELKSYRLVMRRESSRGGVGTKLLLNVALKSYVTIVKAGDKMFRLTCMTFKDDTSTELTACTFLFKTKTNEEADTLFGVIKDAIDVSNTVATSSTSPDISTACVITGKMT